MPGVLRTFTTISQQASFRPAPPWPADSRIYVHFQVFQDLFNAHAAGYSPNQPEWWPRSTPAQTAIVLSHAAEDDALLAIIKFWGGARYDGTELPDGFIDAVRQLTIDKNLDNFFSTLNSL